MTRRNGLILAIAIAVLAIAAYVWSRRAADGADVDSATPSGAESAETVASSAAALDRATGLPPLRNLPESPSAAATPAPADLAPESPVTLPLPPTPPDAEVAALALADPHLPVAFSAVRFWVDRYLSRPAGQASADAGVRVDELFPPSILARCRVPAETRVLAVDDHPATLPGALDRAFRPQPGATWRVTLHLQTPDGARLDRPIELKH